MNGLPEPQRYNANLPRVLIVGEDCVAGVANSLWHKPTVVPTLEAACAALRACHFDVVLNPVTASNDDGLALPSLLLDLQQQGVLSQLPHVLWCSELTSSVLDAHARLARDSGVSVRVVPSFSSHTANDVLRVMKRGGSKRLPTVAVTTPDVSDQAFLQALLAGRDIRIVLQPQVDLRTGRFVGAEALTRWHHPELGDISPSVFMPIVNKAGLNLLLFHFVEARVVALLRTLKQRGLAVPVSVNASAETLCTAGLPQRLEQRLESAGVPTALLKIELTEDVAPDDMLALSTAMGWLRLRGFPIAADDFGCGFSTLEMLTRLPFSELKLDGRFVRAMQSEPGCKAAVTSAISIAREMGMAFIAEGIETLEQMNTLMGEGCHVGQGYALSPPLEIADFIQALTTNRHSALSA